MNQDPTTPPTPPTPNPYDTAAAWGERPSWRKLLLVAVIGVVVIGLLQLRR